jgi:hypothetical protein
MVTNVAGLIARIKREDKRSRRGTDIVSRAYRGGCFRDWGQIGTTCAAKCINENHPQ